MLVLKGQVTVDLQVALAGTPSAFSLGARGSCAAPSVAAALARLARKAAGHLSHRRLHPAALLHPLLVRTHSARASALEPRTRIRRDARRAHPIRLHSCVLARRCLDEHKCLAGIWLVPISEIANGMVKWAVRRARPAWEDSRVRQLVWSAEFSFPSSHAQLAFVLADFFVRASSHPHARTGSPGWPAYAYAAAVALSRVHAGVHYPSDVVVGSAWGLATSALYDRMLPALMRWAPRSGVGQLAALSLPGLAAAFAVLHGYRRVRASFGAVPAAWRSNICKGKYAERELDPCHEPLGLYTGMLGVLAGLAVGSTLRHQLAPLAYPASWRQGALRALLGNVGLMLMFEGIAAATPRKPVHVYTTLRFLKCAHSAAHRVHGGCARAAPAGHCVWPCPRGVLSPHARALLVCLCTWRRTQVRHGAGLHSPDCSTGIQPDGHVALQGTSTLACSSECTLGAHRHTAQSVACRLRPPSGPARERAAERRERQNAEGEATDRQGLRQGPHCAGRLGPLGQARNE